MSKPKQIGTAALSTYHRTAADIRRCLDLGDIAAEYGNARRAAEYLLGALEELAPELEALGSARRCRS